MHKMANPKTGLCRCQTTVSWCILNDTLYYVNMVWVVFITSPFEYETLFIMLTGCFCFSLMFLTCSGFWNHPCLTRRRGKNLEVHCFLTQSFDVGLDVLDRAPATAMLVHLRESRTWSLTWACFVVIQAHWLSPRQTLSKHKALKLSMWLLFVLNSLNLH